MVDIRMHGPGMNCLGTPMMTWVIDQLDRAGGAPVLLTGSGRSFSAGLDLKEVASLDGEQMRRFLEDLVRMTTALFNYPGPLVAWVNGHAIAGGCIVALACDAAIATRDARVRIGLNEVALGLRFPPPILEMVRYRIDSRHLTSVLLGAGLHPPEGAARLGLVDAAVDDAESVARATLAGLAAHPPDAFALAKADLRGRIMATSPELTRLFQEQALPMWTAPELKAKVRALLER